MFELFVALLLFWLAYKLYKVSKEKPKEQTQDTRIYYTVPFGYLKDGEKDQDLT